MNTPIFHTFIERNIKLLATLCVLSAVKAHVIKANLKICSIANKVFTKGCTAARNYFDSLMDDSEVQGLIEHISDAELAAMAIDYISEFNVPLYPYKSMNGIEGTTEFQVILSEKGFTQEHLKRYDEMCDGKPKNRLYSLLCNVVVHLFSSSDPSTCITSPGSKKTFSKKVDIEKLIESLENPQKKIGCVYEIFARTCSLSLALKDHVERFVLNDKDIEVANYLICIKQYPLYLIDTILDMVNSDEFRRLQNYANEDTTLFRQERNKYFSNLNKILGGIKSIDKLNQRSIKAAACFFMKVNLSFSGCCDGIHIQRVRELTAHKLAGMFPLLLSTAQVFQRAEITNKDFMDIIKTIDDSSNSLIYLDSPYVKEDGNDDGAYPLDFSIKDIRRMVDATKNYSHVFATHTACIKDVKSAFENAQYDRVTYKSKCFNTSFYTDVYFKGISEDTFPEKNFCRNWKPGMKI